MNLTEKQCQPCEGGVEPLGKAEVGKLLKQLDDGWTVRDDYKRIRRHFRFDSFKHAFVFLMGLAHLAEAEGHHPDIHNSYDTVDLELSTHAIGGLSENDFILAAKIDRMHEQEFA